MATISIQPIYGLKSAGLFYGA